MKKKSFLALLAGIGQGKGYINFTLGVPLLGYGLQTLNLEFKFGTHRVCVSLITTPTNPLNCLHSF